MGQKEADWPERICSPRYVILHTSRACGDDQGYTGPACQLLAR